MLNLKLAKPVMLAALIGKEAAVPLVRARAGLVNSTGTGLETCKLNGMLGPALYMSLP